MRRQQKSFQREGFGRVNARGVNCINPTNVIIDGAVSSNWAFGVFDNAPWCFHSIFAQPHLLPFDRGSSNDQPSDFFVEFLREIQQRLYYYSDPATNRRTNFYSAGHHAVTEEKEKNIFLNIHHGILICRPFEFHFSYTSHESSSGIELALILAINWWSEYKNNFLQIRIRYFANLISLSCHISYNFYVLEQFWGFREFLSWLTFESIK